MSDAITKALAANIKRASDDDGSFETHDLDQLMAAEQYEKAKSVSNPFKACLPAKAIAAGPVQ